MEIDRITQESIEAGMPENAAHAARASLRRKYVELVNAAEVDISRGMPLLMDATETERLFSIAQTAALQAAGAKDQLDELTDRIFRALAAFVSRGLAEQADRREALRVVRN
ncbi:hypothetical protein D3227_35095 [Mesorhizobium waimense]|uniref:Uncharacterized protein n=1 Tax=Mesorhizobium waimense TaxID=1300307 RepID=A0A3A5K7A4_9HYPH|nr:hypothetical protein [Mesorhizobium waimense]RJT28124.1 hypothetical protein D3227_35095 [Mesorhizobium waimense]